MGHPFHNVASFGKRQEYVVIAELLRRGFDVHRTLVDDQGIDCIIRREGEGGLRYLDIQIFTPSRLILTGWFHRKSLSGLPERPGKTRAGTLSTSATSGRM